MHKSLGYALRFTFVLAPTARLAGHPSVGAEVTPGLFESLRTYFHAAVRLEVDVAMCRTVQESSGTDGLQWEYFSVLEAIDTRIDGPRLSGIGVDLFNKHNTTALCREARPFFAFLEAVFKCLQLLLEHSVAAVEFVVLSHHALVLAHEIFVLPSVGSSASNPANRGDEPVEDPTKSREYAGQKRQYSANCDGPSNWATAPRKGGANQLHAGSPSVEKGGVGTSDFTARGNGAGEGNYA